MHTVYLDYVRLEENGDVKEKALKFVNMPRSSSSVHCHKVLVLSDAVQEHHPEEHDDERPEGGVSDLSRCWREESRGSDDCRKRAAVTR